MSTRNGNGARVHVFIFSSAPSITCLSRLWDEGVSFGGQFTGPGCVPGQHTPGDRLPLMRTDAQTNGWMVYDVRVGSHGWSSHFEPHRRRTWKTEQLRQLESVRVTETCLRVNRFQRSFLLGLVFAGIKQNLTQNCLKTLSHQRYHNSLIH